MFIFIWLHNIRQYKQPPGGREAVGQFRSDLYNFVGLFLCQNKHIYTRRKQQDERRRLWFYGGNELTQI